MRSETSANISSALFLSSPSMTWMIRHRSDSASSFSSSAAHRTPISESVDLACGTAPTIRIGNAACPASWKESSSISMFQVLSITFPEVAIRIKMSDASSGAGQRDAVHERLKFLRVLEDFSGVRGACPTNNKLYGQESTHKLLLAACVVLSTMLLQRRLGRAVADTVFILTT